MKLCTRKIILSILLATALFLPSASFCTPRFGDIRLPKKEKYSCCEILLKITVLPVGMAAAGAALGGPGVALIGGLIGAALGAELATQNETSEEREKKQIILTRTWY